MLALIGFCWLVGGPLLRLLIAPMYDTQVVHALRSPDQTTVAEVEVRTGGFGTVWTTRVHLRPDGTEQWTVYQTKDSDFEPPLRWANADTLVIGLPCDRFDYVSNPDDWARSDPSERRYRVRFEYPADCRPV